MEISKEEKSASSFPETGPYFLRGRRPDATVRGMSGQQLLVLEVADPRVYVEDAIYLPRNFSPDTDFQRRELRFGKRRAHDHLPRWHHTEVIAARG